MRLVRSFTRLGFGLGLEIGLGLGLGLARSLTRSTERGRLLSCAHGGAHSVLVAATSVGRLGLGLG